MAKRKFSLALGRRLKGWVREQMRQRPARCREARSGSTLLVGIRGPLADPGTGLGPFRPLIAQAKAGVIFSNYSSEVDLRGFDDEAALDSEFDGKADEAKQLEEEAHKAKEGWVTNWWELSEADEQGPTP